jgi:DNA-binding protein HU-beta
VPILALGVDGCRATPGARAATDLRKMRKNAALTTFSPAIVARMHGAGGPGSRWLSANPVSFDVSYHSQEEQVTKSEFVDQVADRAGLSKKDAGDAVDAMLETIEGALKRGSEVVFSGFGKFSVSDRSAREGRNPATGEKIQIAASRVPKFTAGAALKKAVK